MTARREAVDVPARDDSGMNTTSTDFIAGKPHRSLPIRRLARAVAPLASPLAGSRWFPIWAVLRHTGRTSGTRYSTPIVALPTPDGFVIPLPFGDATQWAKNLFAAGGGSIRVAGREHRIVEPEIVDQAVGGAHLPAPLRFMARRLGIRQYVLVRKSPAGSSVESPRS
jgi:deazaflavin-dependent oxidoreductase (nitroreductase family)